MGHYALRLSKDRFKFSAAHMTIFSAAGRAENLHGHNYRVRLTVAGAELERGMLHDPQLLKRKLDEICGLLDEKTLLPSRAPELIVEESPAEFVRVSLFSKAYQFPAADVLWLPLDNITMENLADYFCQRLIDELALRDATPALHSIRVSIAESPGQSIARCVRLKH